MKVCVRLWWATSCLHINLRKIVTHSGGRRVEFSTIGKEMDYVKKIEQKSVFWHALTSRYSLIKHESTDSPVFYWVIAYYGHVLGRRRELFGRMDEPWSREVSDEETLNGRFRKWNKWSKNGRTSLSLNVKNSKKYPVKRMPLSLSSFLWVWEGKISLRSFSRDPIHLSSLWLVPVQIRIGSRTSVTNIDVSLCLSSDSHYLYRYCYRYYHYPSEDSWIFRKMCLLE